MIMVCMKCRIELRPYRNGVTAVSMTTCGPYKVYRADEWHCPSCGWRGLLGFSITPSACDGEKDFQLKRAKAETNPEGSHRFWLNEREKTEYELKGDA